MKLNPLSKLQLFIPHFNNRSINRALCCYLKTIANRCATRFHQQEKIAQRENAIQQSIKKDFFSFVRLSRSQSRACNNSSSVTASHLRQLYFFFSCSPLNVSGNIHHLLDLLFFTFNECKLTALFSLVLLLYFGAKFLVSPLLFFSCSSSALNLLFASCCKAEKKARQTEKKSFAPKPGSDC